MSGAIIPERITCQMGTSMGTVILSTSVALAGLLLVFLGFVLSTYQSYAADTSPKVRDKYRSIALKALIVFAICVITSLLSLTFLLTGSCFLYWLIISLFYVEILCVLLIAILAVTKIIRR
jgi:cytochrome bd-type quinol oxidase subunit 2